MPTKGMIGIWNTEIFAENGKWLARLITQSADQT